VIIEEWSPKNEVTASALKIWADRYPFTAQIKGGVLQKIRPAKIIVISNYRLSDCFPDARDADPIARRFKEFEFPQDLEEASEIATKFVEEHAPVGEPPELEELVATDDVPDIPDIESLLGEDYDVPESIRTANWVDCMTPDQFSRFFLDDES